MNHFKPKKVACFRCQIKFPLKFVIPRQAYSQKNNWGYWTENPSHQNQYICNSCLKDLYYNHKEEYWQAVKNKMKRQTIRNYIYSNKLESI